MNIQSNSNTTRPTPIQGVAVTTRHDFDWLSNAEQVAVMQAALNAGDNLQSILVTMHANHTTIELIDWTEENCGIEFFFKLGGWSAMKLIELQAQPCKPMTKLELVQGAIYNEEFQHELDIAAGEYWDKAGSRIECINHLIEFALQSLPSHLNLDRLLRREVNQDFRLRIA